MPVIYVDVKYNPEEQVHQDVKEAATSHRISSIENKHFSLNKIILLNESFQAVIESRRKGKHHKLLRQPSHP